MNKQQDSGKEVKDNGNGSITITYSKDKDTERLDRTSAGKTEQGGKK